MLSAYLVPWPYEIPVIKTWSNLRKKKHGSLFLIKCQQLLKANNALNDWRRSRFIHNRSIEPHIMHNTVCLCREWPVQQQTDSDMCNSKLTVTCATANWQWPAQRQTYSDLRNSKLTVTCATANLQWPAQWQTDSDLRNGKLTVTCATANLQWPAQRQTDSDPRNGKLTVTCATANWQWPVQWQTWQSHGLVQYVRTDHERSKQKHKISDHARSKSQTSKSTNTATLLQNISSLCHSTCGMCCTLVQGLNAMLLPLAWVATVISRAGRFTSTSYRSVNATAPLSRHPAT